MTADPQTRGAGPRHGTRGQMSALHDPPSFWHHRHRAPSSHGTAVLSAEGRQARTEHGTHGRATESAGPPQRRTAAPRLPIHSDSWHHPGGRAQPCSGRIPAPRGPPRSPGATATGHQARAAMIVPGSRRPPGAHGARCAHACRRRGRVPPASAAHLAWRPRLPRASRRLPAPPLPGTQASSTPLFPNPGKTGTHGARSRRKEGPRHGCGRPLAAHGRDRLLAPAPPDTTRARRPRPQPGRPSAPTEHGTQEGAAQGAGPAMAAGEYPRLADPGPGARCPGPAPGGIEPLSTKLGRQCWPRLGESWCTQARREESRR